MQSNERKWQSILPVCLILAALAFIGFRWGKPIIELVSDPEAFRKWVDSRGPWGPIVMVASIALQILVAVIPGEPLEFAAGYAFGVWQGLLLCMIGSFIGGAIAMLLARRYGLKLVKALFPKQNIEDSALFKNPDRLKMLTFILFLIPGTPKDFMIYALGLTPMSVIYGMTLTTFARIPSIITSTLSGHAMGEAQYLTSIIIYAVTGVASLLAIWAYRKKTKNTDSVPKQDS